jgi:hypothetical protein
LDRIIDSTKRALFHGHEQTEEYYFLHRVNGDVLAHLENIMGSGVLESINHHLRIQVDADLSQVVSHPSTVEAGLRKLFGVGSKVIIEQCIYAAFRSVGLIPDRDYRSLKDAIDEMRDGTINFTA